MATESMIERVARSLLAADYPDDVGGEMEHLWWDRHGHTYFRYARAAIEAMREPTDEMLAAVRAAASDQIYSNGIGHADLEDGAEAEIITAMIGAASKAAP
ncbi:hypothetical protein FF80_03331 [Devosia sp. LC5]|uniref:hypothetical protein n=1 Tax=Devosia sp. LC5 TaxID=1502724 RepID=UPI0004E3CB5A|nr:hypothetical protein [Devosia sp. LC5]KFC62764.1 hypothetical protein FF80_03331 [Devosia sp. LC5]